MGAGADARACSRQAAWPAGSFAKHAGKVGKLTTRPDSDGDTKLEWADGSGTSGCINARELARATESDFQKVRPRRKGQDTGHAPTISPSLQPRKGSAVWAARQC